MAAKELSLPETAGKYGALGILAIGTFMVIETAFSYPTALALATAGIYFGLAGAAIWGVRQLTKLFAKKEAA